MTIGLAVLIAYAVAIAGVALLVAGRLVRCGYRAARVARYAIVASCVAGIAARSERDIRSGDAARR